MKKMENQNQMNNDNDEVEIDLLELLLAMKKKLWDADVFFMKVDRSCCYRRARCRKKMVSFGNSVEKLYITDSFSKE